MGKTKDFDNVNSFEAINAARGRLTSIKRRLRRTDDALLADLNRRIGELDRALYHAKEIAALLTTAREMRGRD